jgi:ubiquinone/menaquinone biosynthesis C-methylase UbiE
VVTEFSEVTELAGTEISAEQLERMSHRYHWAAQYSRNKDVLEVGCGSGQGLGLLLQLARSVEAGDYSQKVLSIPRSYYGDRVALREFDAQALPYADSSKDVIILFETIYYVQDAARFVRECRRVLRPGGDVLIATANKDLSDFNPSPLSHQYYGTMELVQLFRAEGFEVQLYGHLPVDVVSWRQKVLRPIKRLIVGLGLMPKTMKGKKVLKRLVFGKLIPMPAELKAADNFIPPTELSPAAPDRVHKVLYCRATMRV